MKILLYGLLAVSLNTLADPICELHKARAELSATVLGSPYAYGSSNENGTATMALGYSLAGRNKAQLARELADAKCASLESTTILDEQQKWTMIAIHKAGAKNEVVLLLKSREMAKSHVELVERQLKAQVATLGDYNSARQVLTAIDSRILALKMVLAEASVPVNTNNVKDLLSKAKASEGTVAEIMAKQEAADAWDVVLGAGAQKNMLESSSEIKPFVGLTFKWSFGNVGVKESVANVRNKSEEAFVGDPRGYVKTADLLITKLQETLVVERERETLLADIVQDTNRILETFKGIDTALAQSTKLALEIQSGIYSAELAGVRTRIKKLDLTQ